MSLDGLVTRAIAQEIGICTGGRIHKIHQPSEHDIVMQIRAQGNTYKLLLSANPTYPRVHFTGESFVNPVEAPMFCMLLRKHCEGAVIESITQIGMERMLKIDVRQRDEIGDVSLRTIIVEIMGRHSNIIVMDPASGSILDGIHHVTPAISSYRIVMPGTSYVMPPEQGKIDPLQTDYATFIETLTPPEPEPADDDDEPSASQPDKLQQLLVARFSGISPLVAREIEHRSGYMSGIAVSEVDKEIVWSHFNRIMSDVQEQRGTPNIVTNPSTGKSFFSVVELTHLQGESTRYASMSECLEAYYGDKAERDTVKQRTADMTRFLINE
ncbi:MAG: fibronectin/fibrinogen-binding protein, partial [Paenibacillus sp.]|nr:fibronectin/fibrinogen-binding protein [Paenibacillus sp.]